MTARLVAEEGFLKGIVLSLEEGDSWTIGRDPSVCQLLVEDPSVSRQHAICRKTAEGITIENMSSTNPLQINDKGIKAPHLLKQGDAVKVGSILFRFYSDPEAHVDEFPEDKKTSETPLQEPSVKESPTAETPSEIEKELSPPSDTSQPDLSIEVSQPDLAIGTGADTGEHLDEAHGDEEETHNTIFEDSSEVSSESSIPSLADIDFNVPEAGKWLLKVISGPNNGAEFSLQADTVYTIGTDPTTCDIVFQDVSVSRRHARLTISKDEQAQIEDLKSRNGTFIDSKQITEPVSITADVMITLGTTTFVILDREGERTTMAAPVFPSISKALEGEEPLTSSTTSPNISEIIPPLSTEPPEASTESSAEGAEDTEKPTEKASATKTFNVVAAAIIVGLMVSILAIVSLGIRNLFKTEEVVRPEVDFTAQLDAAIKPFTPAVRYSFNKNSGTLLLVGHVLSSTDRTQLFYNLQGLPFIKNIDDNIIIDELVWQDINQVLSKNPAWRSISIHSPTPGHFVLSGYLKTRKQAEQLSEYLTQNFSYLDLLENRLVVEEDLDSTIDHLLLDEGLPATAADFADGVVVLHGTIEKDQKAKLDTAIEKIKALNGVRSIKNTITITGPTSGIIDLTDKYAVTGFSSGNGKSNVVINGRILFIGDTLDGMTVTNIEPTIVSLEKGGVKYKIEYNK